MGWVGGTWWGGVWPSPKCALVLMHGRSRTPVETPTQGLSGYLWEGINCSPAVIMPMRPCFVRIFHSQRLLPMRSKPCLRDSVDRMGVLGSINLEVQKILLESDQFAGIGAGPVLIGCLVCVCSSLGSSLDRAMVKVLEPWQGAQTSSMSFASDPRPPKALSPSAPRNA